MLNSFIDVCMKSGVVFRTDRAQHGAQLRVGLGAQKGQGRTTNLLKRKERKKDGIQQESTLLIRCCNMEKKQK